MLIILVVTSVQLTLHFWSKTVAVVWLFSTVCYIKCAQEDNHIGCWSVELILHFWSKTVAVKMLTLSDNVRSVEFILQFWSKTVVVKHADRGKVKLLKAALMQSGWHWQCETLKIKMLQIVKQTSDQLQSWWHWQCEKLTGSPCENQNFRNCERKKSNQLQTIRLTLTLREK